MTEMTSTRTVYVISRWTEVRDPACITFRPSGYDDPAEEVPRHLRYDMDRKVWEEMGRPQTITLTVEPGDKLND